MYVILKANKSGLTVRLYTEKKDNNIPVFQRYKSPDLPRITERAARPADDCAPRACNPLADYHFDVRHGRLHGIYDYNNESNNIKNVLL